MLIEKRAKRSPTRRPGVDLVVWSETMMPPLNTDARLKLERGGRGSLLWDTDYLIGKLASVYRTNLLVGGMYWSGFKDTPDGPRPTDSRNVAYYYERNGPVGRVPQGPPRPVANIVEERCSPAAVLARPAAHGRIPTPPRRRAEPAGPVSAGDGSGRDAADVPVCDADLLRGH